MINVYSPRFATQLATGFLGPEAPPPQHMKQPEQERPLLIGGVELERAMLLYRHQDLLATLLPERVPRLSRRDALAVPLGDHALCAHALLFGDGSFGACVSAEARIEVAKAPFALLEGPLRQADAASPEHALIDGQLRALPPGTLLHALQRGPGHVTREMAEVIDMRPHTFVLPAALVFWRSLTEHHAAYEAALHKRASGHPIWQRLVSADARVRICLVLLSSMNDRRVLAALGGLYAHRTPWSRLLMTALAGLPGGGAHLMRVATDPAGDKGSRHMAVQGVVLHALCHPDDGLQLCTQLLHHPTANLSPALTERLQGFSQMSAETLKNASLIVNIGNEIEHPPGVPALAPAGHYQAGLPLARRFPAAAEAERVQREWTAHLQRPMPDAKRREPVVHSGPRQGRNERCECGSGKKYKQCCLNSGAQARSGS